ncbi:hypothetical protein [Paenibacillus sp. Marseille-Q4541]|uniref:hypothetical protein n=1 Tax=Paenibacillus sp. Marseille-Q4541 TaxID=2831522 RepID=UPI001BA5B0A7|nr:hypothetical protein [Paenibacillus sp. Marseille-Q4541]
MTIGVIIIFIKMAGSMGTGDVNKQLLSIGGFGESMNRQPQREVIFSYSSTIENKAKQALSIHSVEPILSAPVEKIMINPERQILIYDRVLKPNGNLDVQGEFVLDTSQMTEEEIAQLLPGVTAYKITYNDGHEVVLQTNIYHR